jgi:hypothetical protein
MANATQNGGLRLYKPSVQPNELIDCLVAAGDGTRLGPGDPVIKVNTGSDSINQGPVVQIVTRAASSGAIFGVVVAVLPQWSDGTGTMDLSKTYRPASTAEYVKVRRANNLDQYEIQASGSTVKADVGLNGDLVIADCDTSTGLSTCQWNSSAQDTTATRQLKCIGFVDDVANDPTSANARLIVTINNADGSGGTGTAGV